MQISLLPHVTYDRTCVFLNACVKALENLAVTKERKLKIKGIIKKTFTNLNKHSVQSVHFRVSQVSDV